MKKVATALNVCNAYCQERKKLLANSDEEALKFINSLLNSKMDDGKDAEILQDMLDPLIRRKRKLIEQNDSDGKAVASTNGNKANELDSTVTSESNLPSANVVTNSPSPSKKSSGMLSFMRRGSSGKKPMENDNQSDASVSSKKSFARRLVFGKSS